MVEVVTVLVDSARVVAVGEVLGVEAACTVALRVTAVTVEVVKALADWAWVVVVDLVLESLAWVVAMAKAVVARRAAAAKEAAMTEAGWP